jgi:hypothetical protein
MSSPFRWKRIGVQGNMSERRYGLFPAPGLMKVYSRDRSFP